MTRCRASIFAEADDWKHFKRMMRETVLCRLDEGKALGAIRTHPAHPGVR